MPKFEIAVSAPESDEIKPREFEAIPVLGGDTNKLKEVLAACNGNALVLVLSLDTTNEEMPLPERNRGTKTGGESTSIIYGESKAAFAGINDEGQPLTFTAQVRRKLASSAPETVSNGNETETETDDDADDDAEL